MKIKFKYIVLIAMIVVVSLSLNVFFIQQSLEHTNQTTDIIKVGVYEYEPYIYKDKKGNIKGFYDDFLKLICKQYNFKYQYVLCTISEGIDRLEKGDIDIMLGLPIGAMENRNIILNNEYISKEEFGVFSIKNTSVSELKLKNTNILGLVENDSNAEWIIKFFEISGIKFNVVYEKDYKSLEKKLQENNIDLMIDNAYKRSKYNMIYKFAGEQIYIGGNKNSWEILNNIDNVIKYYNQKNNNPIELISNKYFDENYKRKTTIVVIVIVFLVILLVSIAIIVIIPKVKKMMLKNKIKQRIFNDKYFLQYQPIYNPRNKHIVAFEGLLRLLDKNNNIMPPNIFVPEIEKNDMLLEISLWIIKKAIEDYSKIKHYRCVRGRKFYISLNISLNEIENEAFIKKAIEIFKKSSLKQGQICLEIIERVKINDLNKINKNINLLKCAGFKIALDDFGVEYSNLDVLQNLDVDTIKIDKKFIDGVGVDAIKNEIILFISKIAKNTNKSVILEGVENSEQDIAIKKISNKELYVQGYYYNKPMNIKELEKI